MGDFNVFWEAVSKKDFFYLLPSFRSIHRVRIVHVSGKETSQFCQAQNIEASFFRSLWCTCTLLLDFANIFVFLQKFKVSFITFQKSLYWMKLKNLSTVDVFWAKYLMKSLIITSNFILLYSARKIAVSRTRKVAKWAILRLLYQLIQPSPSWLGPLMTLYRTVRGNFVAKIFRD